MKNSVDNTRANVRLAFPVPANTPSGSPIPLGADGLKGLTTTVRATAALMDAGKSPQGLDDGQATVELLGVSHVVRLDLATEVAQFGAVYRVTADGTYSKNAVGGVKMGWALAALGGAGTVEVALIGSA